MYDREIHFTVNGKKTSDEKLLLCIPLDYAEWFEGHEFESLKQLGDAVSYAECAREAYYFNRPRSLRNWENALKSILGIE